MDDKEERDSEMIDAFLRHVRGRGPRPDLAALPDDERHAMEELFELLGAIADTDELVEPSLHNDPVAIELGLVAQPSVDTKREQSLELASTEDAVGVSLRELTHRLSGDLDVLPDFGNGTAPAKVNGFLPARAVCRTLGEMVLVCTMPDSDFSDVPEHVAPVFSVRPLATAVAVVSTSSLLAVVLTESDCVHAISPQEGWVEPGLPIPPEPFGLALARYLEASLPRWDEVTPLDDALALRGTASDISAAIAAARRAALSRQARIPAKKTAMESMDAISQSVLEELVEDLRAGRISGDELIRRIRELASVRQS